MVVVLVRVQEVNQVYFSHFHDRTVQSDDVKAFAVSTTLVELPGSVSYIDLSGVK